MIANNRTTAKLQEKGNTDNENISDTNGILQ